MLRLLASEVKEALEEKKDKEDKDAIKGDISIATGRLAYPYLKKYTDWIMDEYPGRKILSLIHIFSMGPLLLDGNLRPGEYRTLTDAEITLLKNRGDWIEEADKSSDF